MGDIADCKGEETVVYVCHDKHDKRRRLSMKIWQEIPKRGYVSQPTPLEELVRFSEKAGVRVRIKRDDLLPLGGQQDP